MLLYQFENKKIESLSYRKKDFKTSLSMNILIVLKLLDDFTIYDSCLRLRVVLCLLHEPNYNLKVVILAIVI